MTEEKIEGIMRSFLKAVVEKDADKAVSLCAEDAVWVNPLGAFKGKDEVKRYITWLNQSIPDMKITETGIGIMAQGNAGVYEHVLSGTFDGMKWELLAICVYEFSGEKVKNLRTVYDRLLLAKQVSKGLLAKKAVNSIIENMEKGLK
ncbi:MAG TPA: nuclear transport factor 2 family protein [Dehalococcoidia bacterium]|nr:nuclear transport factor 2 family protein [Dehalococcoidia bacterium]